MGPQIHTQLKIITSLKTHIVRIKCISNNLQPLGCTLWGRRRRQHLARIGVDRHKLHGAPVNKHLLGTQAGTKDNSSQCTVWLALTWVETHHCPQSPGWGTVTREIGRCWNGYLHIGGHWRGLSGVGSQMAPSGDLQRVWIKVEGGDLPAASKPFLLLHVHKHAQPKVLTNQGGEWALESNHFHTLYSGGRLVRHPLQHLVYSVIFNNNPLCSSDLSQFWGSFLLVSPKKGAGVLKTAAEGDLPHLCVWAIVPHLILTVGENLRHVDSTSSKSCSTEMWM